MDWIVYSLVYALFNALYLNFNATKHFNGYLLGIIRGFGIGIISLPLLMFISSDIDIFYVLILVLQGILIGIYDSHIFFASSKYGAGSTFGFMATTLFITLILWWIVEIKDFELIIENKISFLTLMLILMGISVSYWQMMRVHINREAEKYLYPAVFALSCMSIATRYIALNGGKEFDGLIFYLTISCMVSGIYNLIWFYKDYKNYKHIKIKLSSMLWLIVFSWVLISAKTIAFRNAKNPTYVMAILLVSPIIAGWIKKHKISFSFENVIFFTFVVLLILYSYKYN